jgi:hypothetical protein
MTKRVLDAETRKALIGYVPFSVDAVIDYTPEQFQAVKDETLRPIFSVRSMKQSELMEIKKCFSTTTELNYVEMEERRFEIIKKCIIGWKNLFDAATGEEIEYKDVFNLFPLWLKRSISSFIDKISGLSPVDTLSLK